MIYFIKSEIKVSNSNIQYIHDELKEFEEVFKSELKVYKINVTFEDSKQDDLLQLIDNVVGIFRHSYDKMLYHLKRKEEFKEQSEWDMKLMSKIQRKITIKHLNYTVSISDWAAALFIQEMYSSKFPKNHRNRFVFNYHYNENISLVYASIIKSMDTLKNIYSTLNK